MLNGIVRAEMDRKHEITQVDKQDCLFSTFQDIEEPIEELNLCRECQQLWQSAASRTIQLRRSLCYSNPECFCYGDADLPTKEEEDMLREQCAKLSSEKDWLAVSDAASNPVLVKCVEESLDKFLWDRLVNVVCGYLDGYAPEEMFPHQL
jgi:hypothetical protein